MMLKLMIIIIAKAISGAGGSGSGHGSVGTNTNRNLTAITNRNLWLNNWRAPWVIIAFLLNLLLKLKCPKNKSVVLSLPFVLWHRWDRHDALLWMVRANTVSCAGHRLYVRGHASAIRSHRPTLEGNRLLDQGQLLKRGLGQFFWELKLHGQGLNHSLDVVLDASLIDSLVCLEDLRGWAA